jgi:UTP:GlnB (protein PII) uridylyltransferase
LLDRVQGFFVGLLHRVTRALFGCDLDVVSARASTLGDEVVDAFYVRSAGGTKLTDEKTLHTVQQSVREAVE